MSKDGRSSELPARIIPLATLPAPSRGFEPAVQRITFSWSQTPELLTNYFAEERSLFLLTQQGGGILYLNAAHLEIPPEDETFHSSLLSHQETGTLVISFRTEALLAQLPILSGLPPVTFQTRSGPGRFLFAICDLIVQDALPPPPSQTRTRLLKHLTDLLLTTLLDALDLDLSAAGRRRHRQKHMRAYIETRLHEPDLTPQIIAAASGISARALYLLFDGEPGAVAGWILNRRLERIYKDLQSPELVSMNIAEIALKHGFRNAAHFSRRFRQKFGMSPRHVRPKRQMS
ncbi:transcriptional regulator [Gluconobacter oxydans]|uniref:helix-turn-helix domain-containing protein n=1 Tax=Gluconobacter thailandicus TaxID=257438 RepID=UPI000299839B|nr:helix-turn-helix domain-containing protein [Gluconobacter thailandicus]AFW00732.1 transcriptional regulator [Gluconobacter oxydans H24]ANQ40577.1 transcriptional regulator [Gluconobacter oxydans]GAN89680.1 transcriptional regulator [Gluconobacter frateurii M-2]